MSTSGVVGRGSDIRDRWCWREENEGWIVGGG